jgi:hypothetical protein
LKHGPTDGGHRWFEYAALLLLFILQRRLEPARST